MVLYAHFHKFHSYIIHIRRDTVSLTQVKIILKIIMPLVFNLLNIYVDLNKDIYCPQTHNMPFNRNYHSNANISTIYLR